MLATLVTGSKTILIGGGSIIGSVMAYSGYRTNKYRNIDTSNMPMASELFKQFPGDSSYIEYGLGSQPSAVNTDPTVERGWLTESIIETAKHQSDGITFKEHEISLSNYKWLRDHDFYVHVTYAAGGSSRVAWDPKYIAKESFHFEEPDQVSDSMADTNVE